MDYIEEKTPKGVTLKVLRDKAKFLAFDSKGASIYFDRSKTMLFENIPVIVFIGGNFKIQNNYNTDLSFHKVVKSNIVIPYLFTNESKMRYIFIKSDVPVDKVPVELKQMDSLNSFVREIETGLRPDHIIVNRNIKRDDILIIRNRYSSAKILLADEDPRLKSAPPEAKTEELSGESSDDLTREINLNVMSDNPTFLARIHLGDSDYSRVNQLLLDSDLTAVDAEYILSFIDTTMKREKEKDEHSRNIGKLEALKDSFSFYIDLINRKEVDIRSMLEKIDDPARIPIYSTLIAKLRLLFPEKDDQLRLTEYENMLMDKKENLKKN
jgi:hypothetical protein